LEEKIITHNNRHHYLDGIRGIAAVMVVFCHFRLTFEEHFEERSLHWLQSHLHSEVLANFLQPFINMLSNGPLAVFIFWFMSGYVISIRLFSPNANAYLLSAFSKRYFRLAIPALASVIIGFVLLSLGVIFNQQFFVPGQSNKWLHIFYDFNPNFFAAIKNGIWDTFFNYVEKSSYNASLWTMNQELYGSFLCFFLFAVFRTHHKRYFVYAAILGVLFFQNNFSLITFLCGFIMCDLDYSSDKKHTILGWFENNLFNKWYLSTLFIITLLFFAGKKTHVDMRDMLSSGGIVFVISRNNFLKQFLSASIFRWFGKISFSLYLIHLPILCSSTCFLYNYFSGSHFYKIMMACTLSFALMIFLAGLFARLVDEPAIRFSNKIGKYFSKSDA